ncbi:MAG: hypothetical protein ACC652_11315, partial [Acidimicrobiales bacterium]
MLILPEWLITSAEVAPWKDWGLRVLDGQVVEVAPAEDLVLAHSDDERLDAQGQVCLPGFVNSHVHMYGVLAHGIDAH